MPTPIYGWPIPAYGDEPDGPGAFQTLALAIETTVKTGQDAASAALAAAVAPGSWTALKPLYTDDWDDYGGTYQAPSYKVRNGRCYLRGLLRTLIARTGTASPFTLPVGARPEASEIFLQASSVPLVTGAASAGTAHTHTWTPPNSSSRVDVTSSGVINIPFSTAGIPANGWVSLSGMAWDVA